jgi:inhibitor of KinA sporulation pathway (predicted exonuclease)
VPETKLTAFSEFLEHSGPSATGGPDRVINEAQKGNYLLRAVFAHETWYERAVRRVWPRLAQRINDWRFRRALARLKAS